MSRIVSLSLLCMIAAACGTTESVEAPPSSGGGVAPSGSVPRASLVREPQAPTPVARRASTASRVRTETLSGLTFDRADGTGDFRAVFRVVQTVTDIPILLTPAATEVVAAEGLGVTLDLTAPITVANLLDHMTSMSSQLGWRVRDDVVFVEAGAERGQAMRLALYDVRDLTYARTTFIPPRIDGLPAGDDERPRGSGEGEELRPGIEPDALVEIVRIGTDPSYWDGDSGATIDQTETGYLLIRADEAMHLRIERLLGNM